MHEILNIALHGMQQDMLRLSQVGMNLTNATTPGYQRQVVALRPYQGVTPGGGTPVSGPSFEAVLALQQRAQLYPDAGNAIDAAARVVTDSRPGTLKSTGQPLDVALTAPGYFEVTTPEGPAYTRAGQFRLDAQGRMVNALGYPVVGVSGEIVLSAPNPVIEPNGQIREGNRQIAQLKIVQFEEPLSAERLGDGLVTSAGATRTVADSDVQLRQGFVENANVSSMQEMVHLVEVMRHFESMQRMAQGYDDMLGTSIRKLGDYVIRRYRQMPQAKEENPMLDSLYIAATGMQSQQTQVETIANNLANVNTQGFKKGRVSFTDLYSREAQRQGAPMADAGAGVVGATQRLGAGVGIASLTRMFDMGEIRKTDSPFDTAINGDGFIEITLADGARAYTRGGTLKVNGDGLLADLAGHPLKPALSIPDDAQNLAILSDGRVQVRLPNQNSAVEIGRIDLVRFTNPGALISLGDNLYRASDASGEPIVARTGENGVGTIQQGFLESSNVKLVDEMINLMVAQRAYEASVKVAQASDEMLGMVNSLRK